MYLYVHVYAEAHYIMIVIVRHGEPRIVCQESSANEDLPLSTANVAYNTSYSAMLEEDETIYDENCEIFSTAVEAAMSVEALMALLAASDKANESIWATLPVQQADATESTDFPAEEVYKPTPIWERPMGHAVRGIDAFKLLCQVNSRRQPMAIVIGDSGAALTLISERFFSELKIQPKIRIGCQLNLIGLNSEASSSRYVHLDLYFRSQLGPVCLKGIEAYVVKDMQANMLI